MNFKDPGTKDIVFPVNKSIQTVQTDFTIILDNMIQRLVEITRMNCQKRKPILTLFQLDRDNFYHHGSISSDKA